MMESPHTTQGRHPCTGLFKGTEEYNGTIRSFPYGEENSLGNEVTGIDAV
jgi:hypothetical protein